MQREVRELVPQRLAGSPAAELARLPCITILPFSGVATAAPHSGADGPIAS